MELWEKTVSRQEIYDGRVVHLHVDTVELPNHTEGVREIVDHPGGVCVLAINENNEVAVVEQYRYAYGKVLRELPAGKLERGEDPYAAGMRELREETGATTDALTSLGQLYPTPGYCNEIIHLYLARNLSWGDMDLDEDEFLNYSLVPFDTLFDEVLKGEIRDAKTIAAVLKAKHLLRL